MSGVVLVVDDDPLILELTCSYLRELGCEVITALSGQEALQILSAEERIQLLITDLQMPHMDGLELAQRARRLYARLDIVLASGMENVDAGLPLLRKPFSRDQLATVLRTSR
jgi:two-component system cell cycle response regulator CpdR